MYNANYILTGKSTVSAAMVLPAAAVNERILPVVVDRDNNPVIKILPVRAQAGFLQARADPQYWERLPEIALPDRKYTNSTYMGIEIDGESMENTLCAGDVAICEYISSPKYIDYGRMYIVVLSESMPVVKRVYEGDTPETIKLVSDNINYPPYEAARADVVELWRYDCLLRKQTKTLRNTEKVF
jgi:phage repressor protein C with HTH and peptisase S24 domain